MQDFFTCRPAVTVFGLLLAVTLLSPAAPVRATSSEPHNEQLQRDTQALRLARQGFGRVLEYMQTRDDLFPENGAQQNSLLDREQKDALRSVWQTFLDHMLVLDEIQQRHDHGGDQSSEDAAARLVYAAYLTNYRHALDFIALAERNPDADILLNEPVPEIGLPARSYAKLKFNYLNVLLGLQFGLLEVQHTLRGQSIDSDLDNAMRADARRIWAAGKGEGPAATLRNGGRIVRDTAFKAFFPVQKGVSRWMGDVKVLRAGRSLITPAQVDALRTQLEPGDILLERREWYLSNLGLPGFWSHAALYIGTPEERRAYFATPEVRAWLQAEGIAELNFESLLEQRYPLAYDLSQQDDHGKRPRVLEAISEGVVFTSLEHTADADAIVVLRPRLPRVARAQALLRAFHYSGRPYDFNFDFRTDEALVCTELIYKAYEPGSDYRGLRLPVIDIVGRPATPANEIARLFDQENDRTDRQLDFVAFLDGHERDGIARTADIKEFRRSWRRPKWHVFTQTSND